MHIAQALGERSCKRVLLLELCSSDQAMGPRFARQADQVRPGGRACAQNHELLQRHQAPTVNDDGQHFPALPALSDNDFADCQEEADQATWCTESITET